MLENTEFIHDYAPTGNPTLRSLFDARTTWKNRSDSKAQRGSKAKKAKKAKKSKKKSKKKQKLSKSRSRSPHHQNAAQIAPPRNQSPSDLPERNDKSEPMEIDEQQQPNFNDEKLQDLGPPTELWHSDYLTITDISKLDFNDPNDVTTAVKCLKKSVRNMLWDYELETNTCSSESKCSNDASNIQIPNPINHLLDRFTLEQKQLAGRLFKHTGYNIAILLRGIGTDCPYSQKDHNSELEKCPWKLQTKTFDYKINKKENTIEWKSGAFQNYYLPRVAIYKDSFNRGFQSLISKVNPHLSETVTNPAKLLLSITKKRFKHHSVEALSNPNTFTWQNSNIRFNWLDGFVTCAAVNTLDGCLCKQKAFKDTLPEQFTRTPCSFKISHPFDFQDLDPNSGSGVQSSVKKSAKQKGYNFNILQFREKSFQIEHINDCAVILSLLFENLFELAKDKGNTFCGFDMYKIADLVAHPDAWRMCCGKPCEMKGEDHWRALHSNYKLHSQCLLAQNHLKNVQIKVRQNYAARVIPIYSQKLDKSTLEKQLADWCEHNLLSNQHTSNLKQSFQNLDGTTLSDNKQNRYKWLFDPQILKSRIRKIATFLSSHKANPSQDEPPEVFDYEDSDDNEKQTKSRKSKN